MGKGTGSGRGLFRVGVSLRQNRDQSRGVGVATTQGACPCNNTTPLPSLDYGVGGAAAQGGGALPQSCTQSMPGNGRGYSSRGVASRQSPSLTLSRRG